MATGYGSNIIYADEIAKKKAAGDFAGAATLEQQRNAKIDGEGLNYAKTNDYSAYLPSATSYPTITTADTLINSLIDKQTAAQKAGLDSIYQTNVNTLNATKAAIPQQYEAAKNQTAGQSAIQRANFNEYAAASGLNSGAGGQAQLAMGNQLQGNLSALDREQASKIADLDLQLANLTTKYKNDVQAALASGDTERVKMLYSQLQTDQANARADSNAQYERLVYNAETLAQYGDFSGYQALGYTPEQIAQMQNAYVAANTPKASSGGGSGYSSATFSKLDSDMQDIYKNNLDVMGVLTEAGKQRMVAYLQQYGGQYGNQLAAKWIPGDYSPIQNASTFSNTTGQYRFDNAGTLFTAAEYNGFAQRVGMNRTKTGQLTEIMNAAQEGKITDAQAQALLKKYGISY